VGTTVAVVLVGFSVVALLAVLFVVRRVRDEVGALAEAVEQLRGETGPVLDVLQDGMARVNAQADRLAGAAGLPPVDERPRPVTRVPKMLRSRSVVKAMALGTGTAHAARRLRHRSGPGNGSNGDNGTAR
jgi:hypothetical protein